MKTARYQSILSIAALSAALLSLSLLTLTSCNKPEGEKEGPVILFSKNGATIDIDTYDLNSTSKYITPEVSGMIPGAPVYFDFDNPKVAMVDTDNNIIPLAPGETKVSARSKNWARGSYTLVVNDSAPAGENSTYKKVVNPYVDYSGKYLIVDEKAGVVLSPVSPHQYRGVTFADGKITSNRLNKSEITVTIASGGPGKYDLMTSDKRFIYWANNTYIHGSQVESDMPYYCDFYGKVDVEIRSCAAFDEFLDKSYLYFDGKAFTFGRTAGAVQIYRLDDGVTPEIAKELRNLRFEESIVEKKVGDAPFSITLKGVTDGGVTYVCTPSDVATINQITGVVTIVGPGRALVMATCPETAEYQKEFATYIIEVSK